MSPENKQAGLRGSLEGGQACRSVLPRAEPERYATLFDSRGGAGRLSCTSRATLSALPCKMVTPEGCRGERKAPAMPAGMPPLPSKRKLSLWRLLQERPSQPCRVRRRHPKGAGVIGKPLPCPQACPLPNKKTQKEKRVTEACRGQPERPCQTKKTPSQKRRGPNAP